MAFADDTGQSRQPYKYNDKELDSERGLNWYDYHARQMVPELGGFMSVDPMAEKYYSWSPYSYCKNNPLRYVDPDGMVARDSVTNKIVFIPAKNTAPVLYSGGADGVTRIKGNAGYVIANDEKTLLSVIQVTHYTDSEGNWARLESKEDMNEFGTNCAGAISLDGEFLPLSQNDYLNFLEAEGYSELPFKNVKTGELLKPDLLIKYK
ncbi:MAG: RHS repeat-associated core domain-containing protein [Bacteroides sp.]|nr:RHS repeat-associated core domain-containing protein [Bacteroides sp.]